MATLLWVIGIAQACCWAACLTLRHVWLACEETLWGFAMAILAYVLFSAMPGEGALRYLLPLGLLGTGIAAFVMLVVDVPMYLRRRKENSEKGARYLTVTEGFWDALYRREPTGAWSFWKNEVTWMTPYFSVCVWLSLAMVWY